MIRIVITVDGGVIQDITASDPSDLEIIIIDVDDEECFEVKAFAYDVEDPGTFWCNMYMYTPSENVDFVRHYFDEYWRIKGDE